ncbi:MAG: hypothetical protein JO229_06790, partial [Alphaproteobacteria bacterium]|nr:hypothetical protein [Alphaproteobacteria bacterium]
MIAARPGNIFRTAAAATGVSAPSLIVLLVLAGSNLIPVGAALISGAVIWAATALIVGRFVNDLTTIRDAVDDLDPEGGTQPARLVTRGLASPVRELWITI